jgi:hypothetical protein
MANARIRHDHASENERHRGMSAHPCARAIMNIHAGSSVLADFDDHAETAFARE